MFETPDLGLAATLQCFGHNCCELNKEIPGRTAFKFEETPDLSTVENHYWQGKLKVEPQAYYNHLKGLKNRLYSEKKKET